MNFMIGDKVKSKIPWKCSGMNGLGKYCFANKRVSSKEGDLWLLVGKDEKFNLLEFYSIDYNAIVEMKPVIAELIFEFR